MENLPSAQQVWHHRTLQEVTIQLLSLLLSFPPSFSAPAAPPGAATRHDTHGRSAELYDNASASKLSPPPSF